MTNGQKTIKWTATIFAVLLSISIIVAGINVVMSLAGLGSGGFHMAYKDITANVTGEVISLDIESDFGKVVFVEGDEFKIVGTQVSEDFDWKLKSNGVLVVKNVFSGFGIPQIFGIGNNTNGDTVLEITIPSGYEFDKVMVENGVGSVDISGIRTKTLNLNLGAGKCAGSNIAADKVDIDAGVGNLNLQNVEFGDMALDAGVGKIVLDGIFFGKNAVDAGVGTIDITIQGKANDFDISTDPGIGGIYIDGEKFGEVNHTNRAALYSFELSGGVGKITLNFENLD